LSQSRDFISFFIGILIHIFNHAAVQLLRLTQCHKSDNNDRGISDATELAGLWYDPFESRKTKRKGNIIMGMNDLYQKQCKEQKEQLEKSLADITTMISMLEIGVKQYPENMAFELSKFYRGMLKDAQLGKEICEKKVAELAERIE
jgi:hypothetical protein